MGRKHPPQFSDPPFIAGQHMLLPPTSALPISRHCPAERPALHSARRARPMQPCPATASCGRSWRQPAPSTGSSCSARCSPPNQRYNWIANKLTSPSQKNTHQRVRLEEAAPTQTALFMDNYHCTLLDAYLRTGIYGVHQNLGEGRNPQNFKEEKTQLGCPSFRGNWNVRKRFKHKPADQPILLAIHQDLWLSVWLHKRTRCCHCQWKCYRPLKSICAANRRDQCYRHQLLDDLHPNVSTCAAVCWFLRIWPYAAYFSKKRFDNRHALLKPGSGPMHEHCTDIIKIIYHIRRSYYISVGCMHLDRNFINLSNKS